MKNIFWFVFGLILPFIFLFIITILSETIEPILRSNNISVYNPPISTFIILVTYSFPIILSIKFWKQKKTFSIGLILALICFVWMSTIVYTKRGRVATRFELERLKR
jgi:hypothetical protein